MGQLSLSFLGGFQVTLDEKPIHTFRSKKNEALLAYLAVESGRSHPREFLAGLIWPEQPEEAASLNLRQALFRLRQLLRQDQLQQPFLLVNRQSVEFNPAAQHRLDVTAFAQLLATCRTHLHSARAACRPCISRLQEAAELYRGDFLAGFFLDGNATFEEWLLLKREGLRHLALDALFDLSDYHQRTADFAAARRYAWQQVELDNFREEAYRQLMYALARTGQRSEALAQYETCRQLLQAELAITPSPETEALYQAIRDRRLTEADAGPPDAYRPRTAAPNTPTATTGPKDNLPPATTPFIGREVELARLRDRLLHPDYRLVTLVGAGGMGKTRLALQVAQQIKAHFTNGVWFVSLVGVGQTPEDQAPALEIEPEPITTAIVTAIAAALNFHFYGRTDPQTQLLTYLRSRELLLILDNFEHLLTGSGLLTSLLRELPGLTILVTSRERLNFQAEYTMQIEGLPVPEADQEEAQATLSSLKLFAERADRTPAGFRLDRTNQPAVADICRLVEGVPLAIELAATWVAEMPLVQIRAALVASLDFLATTMADVPLRHRSLRAVFDYSWQMLATTEQLLLARCSVFRGGFSLAAAQIVTATTVETLNRLVNKSLLRQTGPDQYDMHELLRQFAAEKLTALDAEPTRQRHRHYYLNLVSDQAANLLGRTPNQAAAQLQPLLDNIYQGWRSGISSNDLALLYQATEALTTLHVHLGMLRVGEALFAEAITHLQNDQTAAGIDSRLTAVLGRLRAAQVEFLGYLGLHDQVESLAQQVLDDGLLAVDPLVETFGYINLGLLYKETDRNLLAGDYLEKGLDLAQRHQLRRLESNILLALGNNEIQLCRYPQANEHLVAALRINQEIGDLVGEGRVRSNLALLADNQGDYQTAQTYNQQSIEIFRRVGNRRSEGLMLLNQGTIYQVLGDLDTAGAYYAQSLELCRKVGEVVAVSNALLWRGWLAVWLGDYATCEQELAAAIELYRETRGPSGEMTALLFLGHSYLNQHQPARAWECGQRALAIVEALGLADEQCYILNLLGHAAIALENFVEAEAYFRQSLETRRELGLAKAAMYALAGLAEVHLANQELESAQTMIDEILAFLSRTPLDGIEDPLPVYFVCYQVLLANKRADAGSVLKIAFEMLQARANSLHEPTLRTSLLERVPTNLAIATAWARTGGS